MPLVQAYCVEVELVMRRNASKDLKDLQGMRFKKDGYTFKASQIRRGLSYAAILSKLDSNAEKEQQRTINSQARLIQTEQPREETYSEPQKHNEPSIGIPSLGLFDTTNPEEKEAWAETMKETTQSASITYNKKLRQ